MTCPYCGVNELDSGNYDRCQSCRNKRRTIELTNFIARSPNEPEYQDACTLLREIARIAHAGGLENLSGAEALTLIRYLTKPWWDRKGVK